MYSKENKLIFKSNNIVLNHYHSIFNDGGYRLAQYQKNTYVLFGINILIKPK